MTRIQFRYNDYALTSSYNLFFSNVGMLKVFRCDYFIVNHLHTAVCKKYIPGYTTNEVNFEGFVLYLCKSFKMV